MLNMKCKNDIATGMLPIFIDAVGKKLDKIAESQDSQAGLFHACSKICTQEKLDAMGVDRADK